MSRIDKGNALGSSGLLQPGWTYKNDGYGLLTGKAVFKIEETGAFSGSAQAWGAAHPKESNLYLHTATWSFGALGVTMIECEYVGIQNGLTVTKPNITGSSGLTSEHITTHPKFFDTAIAGPPDYPASSIEGAQDLYYGNNGAHFKDTKGGRFVGFLDPDYPEYYGKTHYLAPSSSFSGVIYTKNSGTVTSILSNVGKCKASRTFSGCELLPSYLGNSWTSASGYNQLLLAQVSFEDYAGGAGGNPIVFKINYELRFRRDGWNGDVYETAS